MDFKLIQITRLTPEKIYWVMYLCAIISALGIGIWGLLR